jgi:hypothetical protein
MANLSNIAWGVFSPDMSKKLYQSGGIKLSNLKDESVLWQNIKLHLIGPKTASWSPDSAWVVFLALIAFTRESSLFLLSADG